MRLDPKVEGPTRKMLGHAMRGELDDLPPTAETLGGDMRRQESLELCVLVAGYIAVDVCGAQWPTDAAVRKLADDTAAATTKYPLDPALLYAYLSRAALGFEPLDRVFPSLTEARFDPILMTAALLTTCCPDTKDPWQYLNEIEEALEAAVTVNRTMIPAMVLRAHMPDPGPA